MRQNGNTRYVAHLYIFWLKFDWRLSALTLLRAFNIVQSFVILYDGLCKVCGSVAEWLGCWTYDQQVTGSNPSLSTDECNPGQVVNTHVPVTKQYNLVPANGQ